ncbi:butyrophilin subfamily 1 member A1-like [Scomber scombrus]|uniref:butyrophilin subfamily 1 member A1-like n=1 Tax=Scomber scombrus TaxID=13677 RepID=UPI002DDBC5C1|nr:butyrophilin subfamily 1 member A1-like [Scomber scombrus]
MGVGLQQTHRCFVVALCAFLYSSLPVSSNLVVLVKNAVSVDSDHAITLPCWLNPSQSAENLEVRWYLGKNFDDPIMLYRAKKMEVTPYQGRVEFGLKDATSGGLKTGDVSLKLLSATLKDEGDYTCYVSSDQGYDTGIVKLTVTKMGAPPILSVMWKNNVANVSCGSKGWHPEPRLRWSDQKKDLTPGGLQHSVDSSGLQSVHSWILVSDSSEVSCSVGLSDEGAKEARLLPVPPQKEESGSSAVGGWVAFGIVLSLLIAVLASLGLLYFRKRALFLGKTDKPGSDEENQKLLLKDVVQPTDLSTCITHYVNVTLEETGSPHLIIKDGKLRDKGGQYTEGQKVTCLTAIKGTPGFSSGQHYWEVSLENPSVGLKKSWWVGVTSAAIILPESDIPLTASNGFWFLSSSPDKEGSLQISTEPNLSLHVSARPQIVGVYLNYDSGELSFYNVKDKRLIASVTASFRGEVFPFFNPGIGDKAPMEILQKSVLDLSSDMTNSVDET